MRTAETSESTEIRRMDARVPTSERQTPATRLRQPGLDWLAPAVLAVLLLVATWYQGGFALRHWAPVALLALVILATAAAGGGLRVPERAAQVALLGLWGLVAWTLLSALWADSPGNAVEGAGRTALYAALFTV